MSVIIAPTDETRKIIKEITSAGLPLDLIDNRLREYYKTGKTVPGRTYVPEGELKISGDPLFSEKFCRCQGFCLMDDSGIGALAHIVPVRYTLHRNIIGYIKDEEDTTKLIQKRFRNPDRVSVVHIYRADDKWYPPVERIMKALGKSGKDVVGIPIEPNANNVYLCPYDIALDSNTRTICIFPNGLKYGISYNLKK